MKTLKLRANIFLFVLISLFSIQLIAQTTYYVSPPPSGNDGNDGSETTPWATIQGAINNSSVVDGDIIIVKDGTYNENVDVTKELTIQSENGYLSTTVVAVNTNEDYVFEVRANNVTIEGFTAYGATAVWNSSGIGLIGVSNCTINSNRCGLDASHQNWLAINIRGNSSNNTISNNIMSYNQCYGINIREGSNNNLIINNNISNNGGGGNGGYGIQNCENSTSNKVRGNNIENNETFGIRIITSGINLGNNDINDKGENTIRNNGVYDISNATTNTINAYYNIWGINDSTTIDSHIYDNEEGDGEVFFNPWIDDPLPVELTTFTASVIGNAVKLNCQTATEVNNYGFSVARQTQESSIKNQDESQSWENITFVEGHGNSNSPKYYEYTDKTVNSGKYHYRLKQIDIDGQFEYSETVEADLGMPSKFELYQNYPNPFNPTTTIKYITPTVKTLHATSQQKYATSVQLKVYDILGNEVSTLVNEKQQPGVYEVTFDASKLASGIYFYRLKAGNFSQTNKMILIK